MVTRRFVLGAGAALTATPVGAQTRNLLFYKTRYCGCCSGWITHMRRAGFQPTVIERDDLAPIRAKHGVPETLSSCHTAIVGRYVLEGHVPPADILRLLKDKPQALGLAVPGMPAGSPGMEQPDGARQRFSTLLVLNRAGRTRIFATHG